MLTRAQLAVIHLAKKQLGIDDDTYRAVLLKHGGVKTAKNLDAAGFKAVMDYFTAWGFRSTWRERTFGERPGMATPRQVMLIRKWWTEYIGADDEAALNKWLENKFHVSALRFLDKAAAQKAITGLRKMIARGGATPTGGNGQSA